MRPPTLVLASLAATALPAAAVAQPAPPDLARRAQEVLRANCYRCHGQGGSNEGGMNFILDRTMLVERRVVADRLPSAKSKLVKRLNDESDPMPPEGEKPRPSADDIAAVRRWIDAGAPDFNPPAPRRAFVSPADVTRLIHDDLEAAPPRDRRFYRYFTLTHLFNAGLAEDELETYRRGLSKLINSLSWGRAVLVPKPIDPDRTVLRIDLRDCKWESATWDRILTANPYGLTSDSAAARACYEMADCPLPHVRGDWFVSAASRPPLYHEVLQLPATDRELEEQLKVFVSTNVQQERVARAGFNGSGVSRNNRLIERHESSYGAYWKSYDFSANAGRKNLFANPLGPGTDDTAFEHDGGEIIFSLPNGLQGYMLIDGAGNRIDRGPVNIVSDPRQADRTVVNGISCMTCHAQGMKYKDDEVRDHVLKNRANFKEAETILALYPAREAFQKLLDEDARRFRQAVNRCTGRPADDRLQETEPVAALARLFEQRLDLKTAAAEAGVTADALLTGLDRSERLARALGVLKVTGQTVQRDEFAACFPLLATALQTGTAYGGGLVLGPDAQARITSLLTRPLKVLLDPGTLGNYRGKVGKSFAFEVIGRAGGTIYGDGVYTDDSYLATVAVHAGLLKVGQQGVVRVTILAGQESYPSSTRNGITTSSYGSWNASFRVEPPRKLPARSANPDLDRRLQQLRDPAAAEPAVRALAGFGAAAVPGLREAELSDSSAAVREAARRALDLILAAPGVLPAALRHPDPEVREEAVAAVRHSGKPREVVPVLVEVLKDRDESVRDTALEALFAVEPKHKALEGSALLRASVGGKYGNLLRRFAVPSDRSYGGLYEYGHQTTRSYSGHEDLPPGFWVYSFPHWYIWGEKK